MADESAVQREIIESAVQREIIESARSYFFRYGFSRVSTGEIASSIGRSKKTLYKYFSTKAELLDAVLAEVNREIEGEVFALIEQPGSDFEATAVSVLVKVGVHVASVGNTLFADLRVKQPRKFQQISEQRRQLIVDFLRRLFDQGVDRGVLRSDVDFERVIVMFLAGAEALVGPQLIARHAEDPEVLLQDLAQTVVRGLMS